MKQVFREVPWELLEGKNLIGVDEVGRGCLAGDVYAAAIFFEPDAKLEIYADSKTIPEIKRKALSKQIKSQHTFALGKATAKEIDQINILQASLLAMHRAVTSLVAKKKKEFTPVKFKVWVKNILVVIDGRELIPNLKFQQLALIKGDQKLAQVSAASIVAKVARDQKMLELDLLYPEYGFKKHKGYPSRLHRQAIKDFGVQDFHRQSFKGVREHRAGS
jgi:ribonuclease HII